MNELYSEEALKKLSYESQKMILLCQQRNIKVCQDFVDAMFLIKFRYPLFADEADKFIKEVKDFYEVIDWKEHANGNPSKWYDLVEYTIKESYGSLFKLILERIQF